MVLVCVCVCVCVCSRYSSRLGGRDGAEVWVRNWSERPKGITAGSASSFITEALQRASLTVPAQDVRLLSLPFATRRDSLVQPLAPCGKARTYIRGAASLDA